VIVKVFKPKIICNGAIAVSLVQSQVKKNFKT